MDLEQLKMIKDVAPDARGRVQLGDLAKGVSKYRIFKDKHDRLVLEPYVDIPKQAYSKIAKGLKEFDAGKGEPISWNEWE